jgi:hypothetical protein
MSLISMTKASADRLFAFRVIGFVPGIKLTSDFRSQQTVQRSEHNTEVIQRWLEAERLRARWARSQMATPRCKNNASSVPSLAIGAATLRSARSKVIRIGKSHANIKTMTLR